MIRKLFVTVIGMVILCAVIFSYIPFTAYFSIAQLTFNTSFADPMVVKKAVFFAACLIVHGLLFEFTFRYALLGSLIRHFGPRRGFWIQLLFINIIVLVPIFVLTGAFYHQDIWRIVLYENMLQLLWTLYYWKKLSYVLSGIVHGFTNVIRALVVADIAVVPLEPFLFYSATGVFTADLKIFSVLLALTAVFLSMESKQRNFI